MDNKHTVENIQYYNKSADRYKKIDFLKFDKAAEYQFTKIIEQLDLSKKKSIIELGAGIGRHSLALAKMGHTVTAVDISQESLDLLMKHAKKNKLDKNMTIINNDFSKVVVKNKYDIGLCISTYQVVSKKEEGRIKILSNFLKSLKSGGTLLLIEPNPFNPLLYFFYLFYPGVQRRNIRSFLTSSPIRLKLMLEGLGMANIKIKYVGFLPLRFINKFSATIAVNEYINKMPFVNFFSAFSYITAVKK